MTPFYWSWFQTTNSSFPNHQYSRNHYPLYTISIFTIIKLTLIIVKCYYHRFPIALQSNLHLFASSYHNLRYSFAFFLLTLSPCCLEKTREIMSASYISIFYCLFFIVFCTSSFYHKYSFFGLTKHSLIICLGFYLDFLSTSQRSFQNLQLLILHHHHWVPLSILAVFF